MKEDFMFEKGGVGRMYMRRLTCILFLLTCV